METVSSLLIPIASGFVTTVLGVVIGWLGKKLNDIKTKHEKDAEREDELMQLFIQNTKLTCKALIYSENPNISLEEKLQCYVIYRDQCHGNGLAHKHMSELVGKDVDEYLLHHKLTIS